MSYLPGILAIVASATTANDTRKAFNKTDFDRTIFIISALAGIAFATLNYVHHTPKKRGHFQPLPSEEEAHNEIFESRLNSSGYWSLFVGCLPSLLLYIDDVPTSYFYKSGTAGFRCGLIAANSALYGYSIYKY